MKISNNQANAIKKIIQDLVNEDFSSPGILYRDGMSEDEIKNVIKKYSNAVGLSMTLPPEHYYYKPYDIIESEDDADYLFVTFELWFGGEVSDLCAEIDVKKLPNGEIFAFLSDIRVP